MRMNIGTIIMEKRKEKRITQQELADFIGVSKASVSKWETNQTYPDITLLPLLAAYFDISIDSLMDYEAQLTSAEIRRIYSSLKKSFESRPPEENLTSIRSFIRRYYSCYKFLLQMGLLFLNHMDLLPDGEKPEQIKQYILEAQQLFVRVRENSNEPSLIVEASKMEAYTHLMLQDGDGVLKILGEYVPADLPVESLIAGAFQLKGEPNRAIETLQSALFQYIAANMSLLTNYLQLLLNDSKKFQQTVEIGQGLAKIFDLEHLHPALLLNFYTSALVGYAQMKEEEELYKILEEFTKILEMTSFPLQFHGDAYFDQVDKWLDKLETGNQLPRDSVKIQQDLINLVLTHPSLIPYQQSESYQLIMQRLKKLQEDKNHE